MPVRGIRGRRSLGDALSGTLVPLQTELSGGDPRQAYHKVLVVAQILMKPPLPGHRKGQTWKS